MAEIKPLEAPATTVTELPLRRLGRPVGRDELLRSLLLRLRQGQQLVLHGDLGTGKTTVAATIANVYLQQHEYPVLWLTVNQPPLAELIARVARAYGANADASAANPLSQVETVGALLTERQPLLVLDGEIEAAVLSEFVARCAADTPLVVTSSVPLAQGDWRNQPIGNLAERAAIHLFKQKAGIKDNATDGAVRAIIQQLDSAAFPIALAARSMIVARQAPADFAATLADALESCDDGLVLAVLDISFSRLNQRLKVLLLSLGATIRGEASLTFLNLLSGIATESIDMSMTVLSRLFLAERFQRADEFYYRLHPLVHNYLKEWALERDRLAAQRADVIDTIRDYLAVHGKAEDAVKRLLIEMENLLATAEWAARAEDLELVDDIAEALAPLQERLAARGYNYELLRLAALRAGAPLDFADVPALAADPDSDVLLLDDDEPLLEDAAQAASDEPPLPDSEAQPIDDSTFFPLDDQDLQSVNIDQLRTALNVASQNKETARQLQILKAIARMQINQGREKEALSTYSDVLEIYEKNADKDGVLETLDMLAGLLVSKESTPLAIEQVKLRTALSFARQHSDTPRVLQILQAVGKVQAEQNREQEAVATYNEVLAIYEKQADKAGTLETLDMLAGLLVRSDSAVSALQHVQRGLHLAEELDDYEAEMFLHITRGDAHRALGEASIALEAYGEALRNARHRDDEQNQALILYKLGLAHLDANDNRNAVIMLEEANDLFKQQSRRDMEGQTLRGLGAVNVHLERWSEAINFHTSALYIAREVKDKVTEAQQLHHLGQILVKANRLPQALTHYRQALHVAYEQQNKESIASVIVELVELIMRNLSLSSIAELLINDGLSYLPEHRDLLRLKEDVTAAKKRAAARGIALAVVAGTAKDYAANAYKHD